MLRGCDHHEGPFGAGACAHLVPARRDPTVKYLKYYRWLTGDGVTTHLLCPECLAHREAGDDVAIVGICDGCLVLLTKEAGAPQGLRGRPGILRREAAMKSHVTEFEVPRALRPVVDFAPVERCPSIWLVLGASGRLGRLDLSSGRWEELDEIHLLVEPDRERWRHDIAAHLHVSATGAFVAVVNDYGMLGTVHRVGQSTTMELNGGDYHPETVPFSFAFVERDGRTVAIHRTAWNRLDASDAATGRLLTQREPTSYGHGEPMPEHYLDYFHGRLLVSPDGSRIADDGWVWHPMGAPLAWSVDAWLERNVWESEDGQTLVTLCQRAYYWDHGMCWLDSARIAVSGLGDDDVEIVDGARIFLANEPTPESAHRRWRDAREGMSFAGPRGTFLTDGQLLFSSSADGLDVWDVSDGALVTHIDGFEPRRRHPSSGELVQVAASVLRVGTVTGPT
jgi:hypothetical protein